MTKSADLFQNRLSAVRIQLTSQRSGDIKEALRQTNQWLQDDPENDGVYKMMLSVANDYPELRDEILNIFEQLSQKGSLSANKFLEFLPTTIQDLVNKADEAYYLGDFEKANRIYRHVLNKEPQNQHTKNQLAKMELARIPIKPEKDIPPEAIKWYRQARSYMAAEDYQTTITFLKAAIDAANAANVDFRIAKELLKATQNLIHPETYQEDGYMSAMDNSTKQVSILFVSADPTDSVRLRTGEEMREIQDQLKLASLRDQFKLDVRLSARAHDISQALLDFKPDIVHFSGHGSTTGALCFENRSGETHLVTAEALSALFEQFTNDVDCVLLNACYSEAQAKAIAKHIDWVIGMNDAIGDEAAIAFSIGFYQALGAGKMLEDAFKFGCVQIRLQGIPEHLIPVLISKKTLNAH